MFPEDWGTVLQTLHAMNGVAGKPSRSFWRGLLVFVLAFGVGAWGATLFVPTLLAQKHYDLISGIAGGLIAFGGLLVGFIVTLMLFTGKIHGAATLSLEQAQAYAQRLKLLLASQAATLFAALIMSVLAIIWLILIGIEAHPAQVLLLGMALFGFVVVALLRAVILPFQIFELHEAALADTVAHIEKSTRAKYQRGGGVEGKEA